MPTIKLVPFTPFPLFSFIPFVTKSYTSNLGRELIPHLQARDVCLYEMTPRQLEKSRGAVNGEERVHLRSCEASICVQCNDYRGRNGIEEDHHHA